MAQKTSPYFAKKPTSKAPQTTHISTLLSTAPITNFQRRVYTSLLLIPSGSVTSYATLAQHLSSSPRAIGGALRKNPFAPQVPCHRVIAANGFVGGFMGEWQKAPSGVNQSRKLELLKEEGVEFTEEGSDSENRLLQPIFSISHRRNVTS
ncbi:DNA binding methylated-DNA--cysteine S-methyltransferase, partial [Aureobasidium melanogenum]|uniref:Methylated-DNA--protein-cysteine methyltransferase n=1 Tax=Aureobasidium melanogenum (strain CBS 110374) TaxID=1043003 RepID=A0A074VUC2_AURM1